MKLLEEVGGGRTSGCGRGLQGQVQGLAAVVAAAAAVAVVMVMVITYTHSRVPLSVSMHDVTSAHASGTDNTGKQP
jgi:uncharacterized membrane protein YedE/YeeE